MVHYFVKTKSFIATTEVPESGLPRFLIGYEEPYLEPRVRLIFDLHEFDKFLEKRRSSVVQAGL